MTGRNTFIVVHSLYSAVWSNLALVCYAHALNMNLIMKMCKLMYKFQAMYSYIYIAFVVPPTFPSEKRSEAVRLWKKLLSRTEVRGVFLSKLD